MSGTNINFTYYPSSNRVPGVFVEMDPSQANTGTAIQNSLVIGQILASGTATPNQPILVQSQAQILELCGNGSMLAAMAQRYLLADPFGPLYLLPLADVTAGVAATGSVSVTGPATQAGTLNLYIGGQLCRVGVASGDTAIAVAASIVAAITADASLPVIAAPNGTDAFVVDLTAKHKGVAPNDIDLRLNYLGTAGGEYPVAGIGLTITAMSGGTSNPLLPTALANLADQNFDFIAMPYNDTGSLNAMEAFLDDASGRWSWEEAIYGGAFCAFRGTLGACVSFGTARNDQHMAIMAYQGSPDPVWIWTAEMTGRCAASLRVDPGLPLQYINTGLQAPDIANRWTLGERNTLLYSGLSTFRVGDDGTVIIERMATTYQENAAGAPDNSYLDVETPYGLMFVARDLSAYLLTRYARKKLVSDTTVILAGSNCVNAPMIKASVIMEYRALEAAGYTQNSATFARNVLVQDAGNGLVKILAPVDLVNQLRQIAILLQFRKS
jgi:phage tail sheath gpL-like